jgi:hypothetical protein
MEPGKNRRKDFWMRENRRGQQVVQLHDSYKMMMMMMMMMVMMINKNKHLKLH